MSELDLNNIVGFKAIDADGNEQQVTVDEMVGLVSARIVSAASEISTFEAAAEAGTDEFEDQLTVSDTFSWLRTMDGSKNPTLTSSTAAAKVLGGLIGIDSYIKDKKRKVVDANETPMNEFVFAYTGSTNLPADSASGGLLTLGFMDGSSSSKLQFFFRHNNVFKRIQWYNGWQNWEKIKTE